MKCYKYKYELGSDSFFAYIKDGIYSTGQLPEEKKLMAEFGVGKKTVYNALKKLSIEGIVRRVKSKGTFVNGVFGKSLTVSGQVAVVMNHTGHYYSMLSMMLRKHLGEKSLLSIPIDIENNFSEIIYKDAFKGNLSLLLNSNIYGVIFDGNNYWNHPFLKDFPNIRSVVVDNFDAADDIPGSAVLIDFEVGIYDSVRHLLSSGYKKIMLMTHKPSNFPIENKVHAKRHPVNQMIKGYTDSMTDAKLSENIDVTYKIKSILSDQIRGILSRKNRPDAIICDSDSFAVKVIVTAMEMGINIPNDLAVIGMYNTPWCVESPIKISSLSFKENEIANHAVDLLTRKNPERKIIKVKPEIIKRESSL